MTDKERARIASEMGYEVAVGAIDRILRNATYDDGTVDLGVYFAALSNASSTIMAQLNADQLLNTYPQPKRIEPKENADK